MQIDFTFFYYCQLSLRFDFNILHIEVTRTTWLKNEPCPGPYRTLKKTVI